MPVVPTGESRVELRPLANTRRVPTASPEQFGSGTGRALQRAGLAAQYAGDALGQVAIQRKREQELRARNLKDRADRGAANDQLIAYNGAADTYLDDPDNGLLRRQGVNAAGVTAEARRKLDELHDLHLRNVPDELKDEFDAKFSIDKASRIKAILRYEAAEGERARGESHKAILQSHLDGAARAFTDPKSRLTSLALGLQEIDSYGKLRGASPETLAAERATYQSTHHAGVLEAMFAADPTGDMARAEFQRIEGALQPGTRDAALRKFEQLERAAAQRAREAQASRQQTLRTIDQLSRSGFPLNPDVVLQAAQAMAGTEEAQVLDAIRDRIYARSEYAKLPFSAQAAQLEQAHAYLREHGVSDVDQIEEIRAREEIHRRGLDEYATDPLGYAVKQGLAPEVPLDRASDAAFEASLGARATILRGLKQTHGGADKLLHPAEADVLAAELKTMTPDEQVRRLRTLARGIDDPALYSATVGQLAAGAPLAAFAGRLAAEEAPEVSTPLAPTGSAAALVLEGAQLLDPPEGAPYKLPSEPVRREVFNAHVGGAFENAPEAYAQLRQGVDALYAALSAQVGDYSGEIDEARYRDAIDRVTGGLIEVNGRTLVKPHTMPEEEFRKALDAVEPIDIEFLGGVQGYSPAEAAEAIREGALVNYGSGYAVLDGGRFLLRPDGQVFTWRPAATVVRQWRRGDR